MCISERPHRLGDAGVAVGVLKSQRLLLRLHLTFGNNARVR